MPSATDRPADKQPYVFVSYASADRERIMPLVGAMERAGVGVWIDREGIHGGENYAAEINDAIQHAAALVLMCSATSLASRNVKQEIALAWEYERPYVPLLLEAVAIPGDVKYWLTAAQWIEVLDRPEGQWLPAVLTALAPLGIAPVARHEDVQLAGRDKELALLHEKLAAAKAGAGGLVLIGGEAGIGKTTLAEAVLREGARQGFHLLTGHCFDLAETPPYGPFIDLFARYEPSPSLPALPDAFVRRGTVGAVPNQMTLFVQVQDFLKALAAPRPVVLLLDDPHWADVGSLDLLQFLARSVAAMPLLILTTYRSDEVTRHHPLYHLLPTLRRDAAAHDLNLGRLDDTAVRALVHERYHLPEAETERLADHLRKRAEGNALFVGELLRSMEESGTLRRGDAGWTLGLLDDAAVPEPLRQVIDARVSRLGEGAQRLLAVAAVVGHEVPLDVWVSVAESDEESVLEVVEQGLEARLLVEAPGDERVRFAHALIREALYEGLPAIRRRRIHRRVGESLATRADLNPDAVANHFQRAGDVRAVEWLVKAGTRARLSYAFVTAVRRYEAALALMDAGGADTGERGWIAYLLATMYFYFSPAQGVATLDAVAAQAAKEGDRTLEALARFQRGITHNNHGHALIGIDDIVAALSVLETLPATETERIRRYLGPHYSPDADRAAVARQLSFAMRPEAFPLAERLVVAEKECRTYEYASGAHALALLAATRGQPSVARYWFAEGRDGYRAGGIHMASLNLILHEVEIFHLAYAPDAHEEEERLLEASRQADEQSGNSGVVGMPAATAFPILLLHGAWALAKEQAQSLTGAPYFLARIAAARCLAFLGRYQGEPEIAARYIDAIMPGGPGTVPGSSRFHYAIETQRLAAALALDDGDHAAARAWLEAHDRWLAWAEAVLGQSEGQALWAEYERQMGNNDQAYAHVRHALAYATEPRQPLALLAAHRLFGELDTEAGRFEDATTHLDASLTLADACEAPYERTLTLLAMAELRAAQGASDDAKRLLDEVQSICEPLGAKPALARADVLAAGLTSG